MNKELEALNNVVIATCEDYDILLSALKRKEKLERYVAKLFKEDLKTCLNTIYNCNKTNKEDKKIIEEMLKEMFK